MPEKNIIDLMQKLLELPVENQHYVYGVTNGLTVAQELEKKKEKSPETANKSSA